MRDFAPRTGPTDPRPVMGLLLLSSDETLEQDMRAAFAPDRAIVHSARVSNDPEIGTDTLAAMAETLTPAAAQLPAAPDYAVIGYGCTSATAVLGAERVAALIGAGRASAHVTTPLVALEALCAARGLSRLALLSPYVPAVSDRLRAVLAERGIATPVFGSFNVASDPAVVRLDLGAIEEAAAALGADPGAEAVFLSCTNLPTWPILARLTQRLGKPVLSSNLALAWHMATLAGAQADLPV